MSSIKEHIAESLKEEKLLREGKEFKSEQVAKEKSEMEFTKEHIAKIIERRAAVTKRNGIQVEAGRGSKSDMERKMESNKEQITKHTCALDAE